MPKTITLSDSDLATLQAIRQVVGDIPHPARPAAIALIDRISAQPENTCPGIRRSATPLVLGDPDNHRCIQLGWESHWPGTDIVVPAGEDLYLALMRPGAAIPVVRMGLEVGDPGHRRALHRLGMAAFTRPAR